MDKEEPRRAKRQPKRQQPQAPDMPVQDGLWVLRNLQAEREEEARGSERDMGVFSSRPISNALTSILNFAVGVTLARTFFTGRFEFPWPHDLGALLFVCWLTLVAVVFIPVIVGGIATLTGMLILGAAQALRWGMTLGKPTAPAPAGIELVCTALAGFMGAALQTVFWMVTS